MKSIENEKLLAEASKASVAVYLATDAAVADDLSRIIKGLAAALRDEAKRADVLQAQIDKELSRLTDISETSEMRNRNAYGALTAPAVLVEAQADDCQHDGETRNRFAGAITCEKCNRIIGAWEAPQQRVSLLGAHSETPKLDPKPYVNPQSSPGSIVPIQWRYSYPIHFEYGVSEFAPRSEFSQNEEDYL